MKPPTEFKVMRIRECVSPPQSVESPEKAVEYWKQNVVTAPWYDEAKECLVVLILNARNRILGHNLVSLGTLNSCSVHAREVYRPVIVAAGYAAILMHSHPSGDATPSEADLQATREMIRAGKMLKIALLDHIIVGDNHVSLRELGFFSDH